MRAELKGLPKELAEVVAAHLVAAGALIDENPELAYRHAEAARRRVARLPIVREAAAETAYAAGHYEVARNEFRALRRMTGSTDLVPVLADCERALGAPTKALALVAEAEPAVTDPAMRVELRLVQAGARADLGQRPEALRLLAHEIKHPFGAVPRPAQARLRYAYASLLLASGDQAAARSWFVAAARIDPDETDALDRLDELDGVVLTADYDQLTDDDGQRLDETGPDEPAPEALDNGSPGELSSPEPAASTGEAEPKPCDVHADGHHESAPEPAAEAPDRTTAANQDAATATLSRTTEQAPRLSAQPSARTGLSDS